ncbi:MAG TPA: GTPase HflX [Gemmatimonadales bacterium]
MRPSRDGVRTPVTGEGDACIPKLHDIQPPAERALLVGAPRRGTRDAIHVVEHLDELARLADTAGATIVGRLVQQLRTPTPSHYLGKGKVAALGQQAAESGATLVLFDEELSPVQGKNLESALELRVMDRAELILDIFATRARSKEARMEVELAQLEYMLPRLARMWVHLSRIRGGIGLRGPGETQIETDRRMIRTKISRLKRDLADAERHRALLRHGRGRRSIPTAALVGYTNAGKSSLLKAVTRADAFVEDRLFATLDTLTRETDLGGGRRVRLVDTVGFIRKLPHHLVASFGATLEEASGADLLLHVIDASHPQWEEQVTVVDRVLDDLAIDPERVVHVFNKMDLMPDGEAFRDRVAGRFHATACVSAVRRDLGALLAWLHGVTGSGARSPG